MAAETQETPVHGHLGDVVRKEPQSSSFLKQEEDERLYGLWNLEKKRQSDSENTEVLVRKKSQLPHGLHNSS